MFYSACRLEGFAGRETQKKEEESKNGKRKTDSGIDSSVDCQEVNKGKDLF